MVGVTRPMRYTTPLPGTYLVLRPRLIAAAGARFDHRVTTLVAAAGMGKTTLLAQAMAENALAPRGTDVWLACDPADSDERHLLDGLAEAVTRAGLTATRPTSAAALCTCLEPSAGGPVCLVLDDVHEIQPGSTGAALLRDLVISLPQGVSLWLASRRDPPVPLSRLRAQRRVHSIDAADLLFTEEELGVEEGRRGTGGWPALVTLAAADPATRTTDLARQLLAEEVVPSLPPAARELLGVIVATGGAGDELAGLLLGRTVHVVAELPPVPLVHREAGGELVPHALWAGLSDLVIGDEQRRTTRAAAARWWVDHGDLARAYPLADGDERLVAEILRRVALAPVPPPSPVLRRWLDALPATLLDQPVAMLVAAHAARQEGAVPAAVMPLLQRAEAAARSTGDADLEVAVLGQQVFVANLQRDSAGVQAAMTRVVELWAGGCTAAAGLAHLASALVANARNDSAAVLNELDQVTVGTLPPPLAAAAAFFRANALLDLGRPEAVPPAVECVGYGRTIPGMLEVEYRARLLTGDVDSILDAEVPGLDAECDERDRLVSSVTAACAAAAFGRLDAADAHAARVHRMAAGQTVGPTVQNLAVVDIATAYCRGERSTAAHLAGAALDQFPADGASAGRWRPLLVILHRLLPDRRDQLASLATGPLWERQLDIARVLAAAEQGDLGPAATVSWPAPGATVLAGLGDATELAVVGTAAGRAPARELAAWLLDRFGDHCRGHLRTLSTDPRRAVAVAATELLGTVPAPPAEPRAIRLLGAPDLEIGGRSIDHPDWRRERVRSLLMYLVVHPRSSREAAIAAIWPDADPEAGRRNLRSTLHLLQRVLEPERDGGDAPYFLRAGGSSLSLHRGEHLWIDLDEFDRLLLAAAEALESGTPSRALTALESALDLWRGEPLGGATAPDWALRHQDRVRSRYVDASIRCAELLAAAGRPADALARLDAALAADPWAERAHVTAIEIQIAAGDRAGAVAWLRRLDKALAELGVGRDPATDTLARRLAGPGQPPAQP